MVFNVNIVILLHFSFQRAWFSLDRSSTEAHLYPFLYLCLYNSSHRQI